jgi:hypothetical protein
MFTSIPSPLVFFFVFVIAATEAAAQDVTLRWNPSASSGVVGYYAYIGRVVSGPVVATRINVGRPAPDASGVARVRLVGVDRTAPMLAIEMTSYDSLGRESVRSNRVLLLGDGETVGEPRWSAGFEPTDPVNSLLGFFDWGGNFEIGRFADDNLAFGSPSPSVGGLSVSRNVGSGALPSTPYELEGRMFVLMGSLTTGVGVRVGAADLSSGFLLGGDAAGEFAIDQVGNPDLRCRASASTGVRVVRSRWFRFRLRHTAPGGQARLRAKVWRLGEQEPSQWQADCWTDVPPWTDSRAFAVYHAGVGITYWDDMVVRPMTGSFSPIPSP